MERYEESYGQEWRMEVSYGYRMEAEGEQWMPFCVSYSI